MGQLTSQDLPGMQCRELLVLPEQPIGLFNVYGKVDEETFVQFIFLGFPLLYVY